MSTARAVLTSMRPRQWTKNLIVFAPLVFAAQFTDAWAYARVCAAFGLFCIISGSVYLLNDVRDVRSDRAHEIKSRRPIASGALSPAVAMTTAGVLLALSLAAALSLSLPFGVIAAAYLALQLAYIAFFKDQVILDVMSISAGFVLRAVAGAVVIPVISSPWLLACTALLALFLALGKRRHELLLFETSAADHRKSLAYYSPAFIDQLVAIVTSATIVTYALYTFFSPASQRHPYLMLTIPFVVYGLFRYLYLVHQEQLGGNPEEILLSDAPLIVDIVLFLAAAVVAVVIK